ncbi:Sirtuin family [Carpediemonas membranifera]|uniref:Sirtuin family n=1 Tax=Carpediemonas membranifera TaxID=201153 RepID=A0A8J6E298_9EUKA|nr:Sirtuin family [Carpediemonas membranifera]|eukprot:KAG9394061.1 Sirtuin family [Carpediemonas membranifera]
MMLSFSRRSGCKMDRFLPAVSFGSQFTSYNDMILDSASVAASSFAELSLQAPRSFCENLPFDLHFEEQMKYAQSYTEHQQHFGDECCKAKTCGESFPIPPRRRLPRYSTLGAALNLIRDARHVIVLTGAGISVSAGVPDFRSSNGLYETVRDEYPNLEDPQQLFDLEYFKQDPSLFYSFAHRIIPDRRTRPSLAHWFIAHMQRRGQLLRNYTQNIDGLERQAGIQRVIQCHGNFDRNICVGCGQECLDDEYVAACIENRRVPFCSHCNNPIKPDIVFFGGGLNQQFDDNIDLDLSKADLLIVMGTSLQVQPVCNIVREIPAHVPQILINRESVGQDGHQFDLQLLGDCDTVVLQMAQMLGWMHTSGECAGLRKMGEGVYRSAPYQE